MEVMTEEKKGLKRTDVGLIPEDWEVKPLGNVLTVKHGKSQKAVESEEGKNPILGTGGLIGRTNSYLYDKPSVLIGRKGTIDKPKYIETPFWTVDTLFYTIIEKGYLAKYIYYYFNLIDWYSYNEASGVPSLNSSTIEGIRIPLPPTLEEQEAIASALSDVDELIRSLDRLIEKKEAIKKGTMQQLLTPNKSGQAPQKRLAGFVGECEVKTLGNLLFESPDYGINAPAVDYNSNYPTYLRITDISEDGRFTKSDKKSVKAINSDMYYLSEGEIVLARTGASTGKSYHYDPDDGELVFAGFLIRIKPNPNKLSSHFLKYFLQSDKYWNWVKTNSMRSGQPGLNSVQYSSLEIPYPPLEEQKAIAQILSDMDRELQTLHQKREKFVQIKQGMMQELLTGKTRLV